MRWFSKSKPVLPPPVAPVAPVEWVDLPGPWQAPEGRAHLRAFLASPAWPGLRAFLVYRKGQLLMPLKPSGLGDWAALRAHQDGGHLALLETIRELDNLARLVHKPGEE